MAKAETSAAETSLESFMVARGRSVHTDDGVIAAGEIGELPADEVARLMALGFLVDPNVAAAAAPRGPRLVADGPKVTVAA